MTQLAEIARRQKLELALAALMETHCASLAETVEALALHAACKADESAIGSVNEQSWTNACTHLFDLAQCGRLFREPTTSKTV